MRRDVAFAGAAGLMLGLTIVSGVLLFGYFRIQRLLL